MRESPHPFPDNRRCLNYKLVPRPSGKTDKIPINALTGAGINAHDPANHRLYAEVAKRGLVGRDIFSPELGVDFDNREQFEAFFHRLPPTYTEFSPSKDPHKVHCWYVVLSGHDRFPSSTTKNFEVYSRDRFFTLTFDHVPVTPKEITAISFEQAMEIFTLAGYDPNEAKPADAYDDESGYWDTDCLGAMLAAYKENVPGFDFAPYEDGFMTTCPGDEGWTDGQTHSAKSGLARDAKVWIKNGWPCFSCFHAHCRDPKKTFNDFREHHDPERVLFDIDDYIWDECEKRGMTGVPHVR